MKKILSILVLFFCALTAYGQTVGPTNFNGGSGGSSVSSLTILPTTNQTTVVCSGTPQSCTIGIASNYNAATATRANSTVQVYNVMDPQWGVYGDCSHDDTAAIEGAALAATDNWTYSHGSVQLYFPTPSSCYLVSSSLYVLGNYSYSLDFVGESGGTGAATGAVIKGTTSAPILIWMGVNNSKIENIDLDLNNVALQGLLITADNQTNTTLGTAVTSPGSVTVTPGSMFNLPAGRWLGVDTGANAEPVLVTSVTGSTFTATFTKTHLSTAPVGQNAAGGVGSSTNIIRRVMAKNIPSKVATTGTGNVVAWNATPTAGGSGGVAAIGDILQDTGVCGYTAQAVVTGVSNGNVTSVNTVPAGVGNGSCPYGPGLAMQDLTHPGETGIQLNVASVTGDCNYVGTACTAGFAVGNNFSVASDEVAGVTWYDTYSIGYNGNANACYGIISGNGNTKDFLAYNIQASNCRFGWMSNGNGQVLISGGELHATYFDIQTGDEVMKVSGLEDESSPGHFVQCIGNGGQVTLDGNLWLGTTPGDGYIIRCNNNQVTMNGNTFFDNFAGSYPKFAGNSTISSENNTFANAPGPYAPFYLTVGGTALLPTAAGIKSINDKSAYNAPLTNYMSAGIITDASQATTAGSGVLRTGDTGCPVAWRNHANGGDVTLCKNASDQVILAGGTFNANTAITSTNLSGGYATLGGTLDMVTYPAVTEVANDVTTGTAVNLLAKVTQTGAIKTSTSDSPNSPANVVINAGGGTSGNAQLSEGGTVSCVMNNSASNTEGQPVFKSVVGIDPGTPVAGRCYTLLASNAVPGWFYVGHMLSNSTTAGSAASMIAHYGWFGGIQGANVQTSNYTALPSDNGKLVVMNCASACAFTLPATAPNGWNTRVMTVGAATATVNLNSLTFNGSASVPVLVTYRDTDFYSDGANYWGRAPLATSTTNAVGLIVTPVSSSNATKFEITGTYSGTGVVKSITPGTGLSSTQTPLTSSGTLSINCDPLNPAYLCFNDTFDNAGGKYGWALTGSGSQTAAYNANTNWGVTSSLRLTAATGAGNVAWYAASEQAYWGGIANWDSHFVGQPRWTSTNAGFRIGYATASSTTDIPVTGFYARYDPTSGGGGSGGTASPDTYIMVCNTLSSVETCSSTAVSLPAQYGLVAVHVRAITSSEIGITVSTYGALATSGYPSIITASSEITICASGCTITATPAATTQIAPAFQVINNSASGQAMAMILWVAEVSGLSRF